LALHDKSVSALLKANNRLKKEGLTARKMEIPVNLINLAKKVETNAAIQDESDSNMFNIFVIISRYHF
jgi:hypothetical protein